MKTCPNCSASAHETTEMCECGADLTGVQIAPSANLPPDGSTPMVVGWACLVVSIVSGGFAWSASIDAAEDLRLAGASGYFADQASEGLATAATASTASWLFFLMFLVFWSVGYIVQAISRLSSKN